MNKYLSFFTIIQLASGVLGSLGQVVEAMKSNREKEVVTELCLLWKKTRIVLLLTIRSVSAQMLQYIHLTVRITLISVLTY